LDNALPGYPFPIPKTGNEAIWNHNLRFPGIAQHAKYDVWNVDSAGVPTLATSGEISYEYPIFNPVKTDTAKPADIYLMLKLFYVAPARRNGEALLVKDAVNPLVQPRRAWQYLPGQRRVKLAPDIAYDTPNPGNAGLATYDDAFVYNGAQDRYDYKLVGKKEMYIPYNNYMLRRLKDPAQATKPNHVNPDLVRWELHRVWVVEATLKPGKRHIYAKRTFYLDEDTWLAMASDQYDARGQLFVSAFSYMVFQADVQAVDPGCHIFYNFSVGGYSLTGLTGPYYGNIYTDVQPEIQWSPETLAGAGVR
jgi:hypothetical protein